MAIGSGKMENYIVFLFDMLVGFNTVVSMINTVVLCVVTLTTLKNKT